MSEEGESEALPAIGQEGPVYFIINILNENKIYKVLKWSNNEYQLMYDGSDITTIPEEFEPENDSSVEP